MVFLSHWHLWSSFPADGPFSAALHATLGFLHDSVAALTWPTGGHHPAVIGFFVLSGFCIHYPFERRARIVAGAPDWSAYFRRRFLRIAPVYWAACLLGAIFVATEMLAPSGSPLLALHATTSATDLAVRFTGLAGVYPREIFAGNHTLTTVTAEMLVYALYPLFFRETARGRWMALGVAAVGAQLFAVALLALITPYWVFNSLLILGLFFYAGALAAHLCLLQRTPARPHWLVLVWLGFLLLKNLPHFYGLNLLKQAAWGLVCSLAILWAVRFEQRHASWRSRPLVGALRWLGDISYSLYAMHTPAIMLATWSLVHLGARHYLLQLPATLAASAVAVLGIHYGIERRFYPRRS